MLDCSTARAIKNEKLDSKSQQGTLGLVTIVAMHPQNATIETAQELCSARPHTGEPNATFGCTEATIPALQCFHVYSINASVGLTPDEATTATLHHQRNQQYSITAVTTSSGSVAERYAYTAYGQPTILDGSGSVISSSAINNRYTYTGREWDQTIGMYHFRARWMSGLSGRFMGRDPIGYLSGELNPSSFIQNNPLVSQDPTGNRYLDFPWNNPNYNWRGWHYHYLHGIGRPVDLARVGLLDLFLSRNASNIQTEMNLALYRGSLGDCSNGEGTYQNIVSEYRDDIWSKTTDVIWDPLYVLGSIANANDCLASLESGIPAD